MVNLPSWIPTLDRRYVRRTSGTPLSERVAALEGVEHQSAVRVAGVTLPALLLNGSVTQTITWGKPMPSDGYSTYVFMESMLGKGTSDVIAQDMYGLQLKTTASVALAAGVRLLIIAFLP